MAIKGAYWPSWVPTTPINTSLFTHIYYAFVFADPSTDRFLTDDDRRNLPGFVTAVHGQNHRAEAMLSIGGGGANRKQLYERFAEIARDPARRSWFIESTINVARQYDLDGLDLDWEYPTNPEEMRDLGVLLREWRSRIEDDANATGRRRLLLSAAVGFKTTLYLDSNIPRVYPVIDMDATLDWVNVMSYDLHGAWEMETGAPAALYDPHPRNHNPISTSGGIETWIRAGMPPKKVIMGLPLYGHSWTLKNPMNHGIGAPAVGPGPGDADGLIFYSAVVAFNAEHNAVVNHDEGTVSDYCYSGTKWIGYDGPVTVREKVRYARGENLGGYFFWALGQDNNWELSTAASNEWGP